MTYAIVAIVLLAALAAGGWWAFATANKLIGELVAENKALRKGAEAHDDADKILAGPVVSGGRLRARLLARAQRYGLPGSGPLDAASASTGSKRAGGDRAR